MERRGNCGRVPCILNLDQFTIEERAALAGYRRRVCIIAGLNSVGK
jgi:hypothetical protein